MTQPSEPDPQSFITQNLFDLAQGSDWKVNLSNENPVDRDYRLRQDSYDAQHRRWRTTILFIAILLGVALVLYYCLQILLNPQATTDDKKWSTAIAASIISAGVGFITGSKAVG
ncbi:hypothetical protein [Myxosarcina sp. GI1]|uniref:hypothetical protein n=1 Tax=Myxosarcina sp. GI1 TaxID=1541065 RepID=UPI00056B1640|nr:hypothetical protein [Myxosarcina sp. GI1]